MEMSSVILPPKSVSEVLKTGHVVINAREIQFIYRIFPEALWSQHGVMLLPVINLVGQAKTCCVFGDICFPWEHSIVSSFLDIICPSCLEEG